jgi:hypothetical protein
MVLNGRVVVIFVFLGCLRCNLNIYIVNMIPISMISILHSIIKINKSMINLIKLFKRMYLVVEQIYLSLIIV